MCWWSVKYLDLIKISRSKRIFPLCRNLPFFLSPFSGPIQFSSQSPRVILTMEILMMEIGSKMDRMKYLNYITQTIIPRHQHYCYNYDRMKYLNYLRIMLQKKLIPRDRHYCSNLSREYIWVTQEILFDSVTILSKLFPGCSIMFWFPSRIWFKQSLRYITEKKKKQ